MRAAEASRRASVYVDMSVRMTKYSAVVDAKRGVTMHSIVGSLARFMHRAALSTDPFSSR